MILSLRVLTNYINPNNYTLDTQFRFVQGGAPTLVFQLIDSSKDTDQELINPPGRRYIPQNGPTNRSSFNGLNAVTANLTAQSNIITIALLPVGASWNTVPQPGDTLTIPLGSVFAGTANANVGSYTILSSTNNSLTAIQLPVVSTPPVSLANVIFSATPSNDLVDTAYNALLQVQISNINVGNVLSRFASQIAPQVDPSLWALQLFPADPIVGGTSDVYLTLNEQGTVNFGTVRGVLQVTPTQTPFAQVSISQGTGALTTF
jgi:hypothetical protein